MKSKWKNLFCIAACVIMAGCTKAPADSDSVYEILERETYVDIAFGEAYHQSEIKFETGNDRVVIPKNAEWGRPGYRDGEEAGIYYGEEEGGETFETDEEISPELYLASYFESLADLELTAGEVKAENYVVQVAEKSKLKLFEKELRQLTGIIMKNNYELTGVEITFDKQCRPIQKSFQLQDVDEEELVKGNADNESYIQKISYASGSSKFESAFKKVKKEICPE